MNRKLLAIPLLAVVCVLAVYFAASGHFTYTPNTVTAQTTTTGTCPSQIGSIDVDFPFRVDHSLVVNGASVRFSDLKQFTNAVEVRYGGSSTGGKTILYAGRLIGLSTALGFEPSFASGSVFDGQALFFFDNGAVIYYPC